MTDQNTQLKRTDKEIQRARDLYLSGILIQDIVEITKLPKDVIKFYAFGDDGTGTAEDCWYHLRLNGEASSVVAYEYIKPVIIKSVEKKYLEVLNDVADNIDKEKLTSLSKQKELVDIITQLDKINRLESGRPTEILDIDIRNWSLKEVRDYNMKNNPLYAETVDASYTNISDDNNNTTQTPPIEEQQ